MSCCCRCSRRGSRTEFDPALLVEREGASGGPQRDRGARNERRIRARDKSERGAAGGAEMLPLGFLVFVVGSIMVLNAWTVVDAWMAVSTASREGARVFVESDPTEAWPNASARIEAVMNDYGRGDRAITPTEPAISFERCAIATVTVGYDLAFINLPFLGGFGSLDTIEAQHSERIDPYRSGEFEGTCE